MTRVVALSFHSRDKKAHTWGDSIAFSFQVASQGVPLNQAKVQLLFDENIVSERFLSVGENNTYSAKLFVPFLANVPDGTAK